MYMLKIVIFAILICFAFFLIKRFTPLLKSLSKNIFSNPLFRSFIISGIWRLLRLLLFKR